MRPFSIILLVFSTAWFVDAQTFSEPHASVIVDPMFEINGAHSTVPRWDNGFLLEYDVDYTTITAADRNGKLLMRAKVWPQGASNVSINDVTASPNGDFVAALGLINEAGPVNALTWLNSAGAITHMVDVPSARIVAVRFAGDGTLWAAVQVHDGYREVKNYEMLRHYDAKGVLMGSALPRGQFKAGGLYPVTEAGGLVASKDRIGVYSDLTRTWVELSYSGEILGRWTMPDGHFDNTTHVYLTNDGEVWLRYQVNRRNPAEKQKVGVHRFDKTTSTYQPVDTSLATTGLLGVDGDSFVATKSYGHPILLWVKPQ